MLTLPKSFKLFSFGPSMSGQHMIRSHDMTTNDDVIRQHNKKCAVVCLEAWEGLYS